MKRLNKIILFLLCTLPLVLFFSYFPVISLGGGEAMNYELSLPLVWLAVFDSVSFVYWWKNRGKNVKLSGGWWWLVFPVWLSLTVIWSRNPMRGILTAGIMWLIIGAIYSILNYKKLFDDEYRVRFWKWFFGASLVVCGWCFLQCALDLLGVPREGSLMCAGCTYQMFGFPHPNGFAIEPQFMGNLLLAPAVVGAWITAQCSLCDCCKNNNGSHFLSPVFLWVCFFIITATLFLTFSRGAIYAFVVGLCFMSGYLVCAMKKKERMAIVKRLGAIWGVVILSFLSILNLQGLMAMVSPTNDTYISGVSKVLNQLSLGIIDVRGGEELSEESSTVQSAEDGEENGAEVLSGRSGEEEKANESVFDGYVEESTNIRLQLNEMALTVWSSDFKNELFGVGIGGAGRALYDAELSSSPKEIVQNEYISVLLETGLIGVVLLTITAVAIVRRVFKIKNTLLVLTVFVSYGVSLMFFSGLPNALHIYLLPVLLVVL